MPLTIITTGPTFPVITRREAIASAKSYTDTGNVTTLAAAQTYTDQRFAAVSDGIDPHGAMNAASTQMAINAAGATGNGNLAVGVGFSHGKSAMAVGYAAPVGSRMQVSFGGSFSGSQSTTGFGFGLKL